jgi:UDP-glucose 4-epimerase
MAPTFQSGREGLKILVTGGAGFIGSHLVDALTERGDEVVVVDNLSTGCRENVNPQTKLYELNIGDQGLAEVFDLERPDIICHHAAQIDLRRSVTEPLFDAQENILGSLNVIVNSVHYRVVKFIYASSGGAIYGEPQSLPVDENHPINPVSQYGVSKHTVEHYLHLYALQYGINCVVLRYANVYGARQNPFGEAGVVAIFARQMLEGKQPTMFGPGNKTRDYTHVSDVVAANLLAMERGTNAICNIGTGVETSDQEIFDAVAEAVGYDNPPLYTSVRPGEVQRMCLDWSRAERELGWHPTLSLKEGIIKTVAYFKDKA